MTDLTTTKPLSATEVAKRLGRTRTWFNNNKKRLRQAGFPKRDQLLGGWHESAVTRWLAGRVEETQSTAEDELIRRAQQWGG